ncbi:hypothetical protein [Variovorax ginsengisoli]|uniref:Lipoprotein n=1 Tax=Variovorax ginsengisoli TaxID=363844 RepID=A0ABT9SCT6_9BURK|nr:hypothetical protein [Variovorax ginsengisoli]MDP9901192.1 hypothetical protein [Variovorax ginsengisoli]
MTTFRPPSLAALLAAAALCVGVAGCATAPPAGTPGCPTSTDDVPVQALYGGWDALFTQPSGAIEAASVNFRPHPEYPGSVRGEIMRRAAGAQLAGDIDDDGVFTLDESQDGRTISAVWSGRMTRGSCGREFKGTWRNAADDATLSFVLTKKAKAP